MLVPRACPQANYGLQQEVDQIPLVVEKGYKPRGWLGTNNLVPSLFVPVGKASDVYLCHLVFACGAHVTGGNARLDNWYEDVLQLLCRRHT